MYKYYSCLRFIPIKYSVEGREFHNKKLKLLPHFIKNCLHVNCLQGVFKMYNDKVLICKRYAITHITDSMITVDLFKRNDPVINFATYDMVSNFEV